MDIIAVIADTNFYRGTSDSALDELCALERRARVRPIATVLACSEILAHLTDRNSPKYAIYRAAIRRLVRHCWREGGAPPFPMIADPRDTVAYSLFNYRHPKRRMLAAQFIALALRAGTADAIDMLNDLARDCEIIVQHRDATETAFVTMLSEIRRSLGRDPDLPSEFTPENRPTVEEYFASGMAKRGIVSGIVMNVAEQYGIVVSPEDVERAARLLYPEASAAVAVVEADLRRVLEGGAQPRKLANSVWDMWFALTAASHVSNGSVPVAVITSDGAIRRAVEASEGRSRAFSPVEYRSYLLAQAAA